MESSSTAVCFGPSNSLTLLCLFFIVQCRQIMTEGYPAPGNPAKYELVEAQTPSPIRELKGEVSTPQTETRTRWVKKVLKDGGIPSPMPMRLPQPSSSSQRATTPLVAEQKSGPANLVWSLLTPKRCNHADTETGHKTPDAPKRSKKRFQTQDGAFQDPDFTTPPCKRRSRSCVSS